MARSLKLMGQTRLSDCRFKRMTGVQRRRKRLTKVSRIKIGKIKRFALLRRIESKEPAAQSAGLRHWHIHMPDRASKISHWVVTATPEPTKRVIVAIKD
jgi:hypothetical protein